MKWTDVWKPDFHYDLYGYVWGKDNVMVFTVGNLASDNRAWKDGFCENMVKALNGEECERYPDLQVKAGGRLYKGDKFLGFFRGYNQDTGEIGNEMIQFVMSKISEI
jgi:hypothetical protein